MPEINQLMYQSRELVEVLIKHAGLHEGRWVLAASFGFGAGNFGPSNDQLSPGAIVAVTHIGLQRAQPDTPVAMTVDAADVNPGS